MRKLVYEYNRIQTMCSGIPNKLMCEENTHTKVEWYKQQKVPVLMSVYAIHSMYSRCLFVSVP